MTVLELDPNDDYILTMYLPFTSSGTPKIIFNGIDKSADLTYSTDVSGAPEEAVGAVAKLTLFIKADTITTNMAGCVDCYFDNAADSKTRVLYGKARVINVC